jgi:hypothetical protein
MSPTIDVVSNYVERSQAFEGTPVQRLLHRQRLARRMANEHRHRFTSDALVSAASNVRTTRGGSDSA